MKVLYVILARGGSKSIPRKNLQEIEGLSLVGYKAIAAQASGACSRLLISTDSEEIRDEAVHYGAEAPFLRPNEFSSDKATSIGALQHAMDWVDENCDKSYDAVMICQPSSPFTSPEHFDQAVNLMNAQGASAVFGVSRISVPIEFVGTLGANGGMSEISKKIKNLKSSRRQDLQEAVAPNGGIFLLRWEFAKKCHGIYDDPEGSFGMEMPVEYSIDIDEPIDLAVAREYARCGLVDLHVWSNHLKNADK